MNKSIHCCAFCANLMEEHPFNQQTWMVCAMDVHGEPTLEKIKPAILNLNVYEPIDCVAWKPRPKNCEGYTINEFLHELSEKREKKEATLKGKSESTTNKVRKGIITLGFDPHGGKNDVIWKRLEGFKDDKKP